MPSAAPPDTQSATVGPGGSISTGSVATPGDPVETTVSLPSGSTGGTVTIQEAAVTTAPPSGYSFLGQQVTVTAPAGTVSSPLRLAFLVDGSLAGGLAPAVFRDSFEVTRNGVVVPDCTQAPSANAPTTANPAGECELRPRQLVGDDVRVTILTAEASRWAFARGGFSRPVNDLPTLNTVKAGSAVPVKVSLGGDKGLGIFAANSPTSDTVPCDSQAAVDPIEQVASPGASGLTYDASTEQYTYVWKTDRGWAGTCRQLVVKFTTGEVRRATFRFER